MRLRRELGEDAITTRRGGYVLRLEADTFDINHLSRLVDEAQSALDLDDPFSRVVRFAPTSVPRAS
jgi:hypothetical protein